MISILIVGLNNKKLTKKYQQVMIFCRESSIFFRKLKLQIKMLLVEDQPFLMFGNKFYNNKQILKIL